MIRLPAQTAPSRLLLCAALACAAGRAFAAHPIQTEDTGTQGAGNLELENGFARQRDDDGAGTSAFSYQPQLSVGISATFDAIVQPSFVSVRVRGAAGLEGAGDTNLDAKWRFYGTDPWSLAVRAGLELPTARRGLGLPHGQLGEHTLLVATFDASPTTAYANLGFNHVPPAPGLRATQAIVSGAVLQQMSERLILTVDSQFTQDPDPARHRWPGDILAGAIWTLRPGLDVDLGWETSLQAVPVSRTWLAGLTWRFSL
jgi:hypothetical protein